MANKSQSFLPYHEPDIITILTQSSLLLILNIVNTIFDKLVFCGLLGQVFIGVAWGTPGGKWLDHGVEDVIVQLGYLGLILLVYEGGLDTNFHSLKANLSLSAAVALTGVGFPMALSFILISLVNGTPLQAFAAGAALCSTSLGTTFTVLSTSGLSSTRLGTVLSSAAMMDDVIGLVMVQVISNLGKSSNSFSAITVVRPLAVSFGFAILVPLICLYIVKPLTMILNGIRDKNPGTAWSKYCQRFSTSCTLHTLILIGLVTSATYTGTSNLFAAYLAGASISWWDSEVPHVKTNEPTNDEAAHNGQHVAVLNTGIETYYKFYATPVQRILKPFFFASIGFAIPITDMFRGEVVWRGIVYTILMLFAKLVTGLWLIRLDITFPKVRLPKSVRTLATTPAACLRWMYGQSKKTDQNPAPRSDPHELQNKANVTPRGTQEQLPQIDTSLTSIQAAGMFPAPPKIKKPVSLYPAAILGTAMTARGEIGFLVASLAETTGLFKSSSEPSNGSSEIYLVVTWAIVLCTIIGPLSVGTLVKRIKRLQVEKVRSSGMGDPLGIWGVN
ncbi:Sodium/hydrogen exchanger family-domain-containing protein [Tricladium varicosporioides]|nr:Sodium/hydrogen exchanger family-domain-containing protein [Hymenoscyphus varicosporioides]